MSEQSVTLLFTDMVGSTAVASRLKQDDADEFRRRHFALLRLAVAENDGVEVKSLGDGLMVVFASASRALSCAAAMQQYIERDGHEAGQRVGLRVGLSGGEVSCEGDDYFGEPVIEAARLCAMCEPGKIIASDIVRLTAGRRTHRTFRSLGELELKGLIHRVPTVEVLWEPLEVDTEIPLPGRLGLVPASGVIGRTAQIGVLTDAFVRVRGGGGREVCLVSGEAGAGKSTLVAEVARAAFESGACVLYGHCEEDLAVPFQLFSQTLNHFVRHAHDERLTGVLDADDAAALARLSPELSKRIPQLGPSNVLDADTERYQLHAAVGDLIASISVDQPVVMVLEDLQWADSASLQLLRHVAASDQSMRLLILGTYRDTELTQTQRLRDMLAALHREDRVHWLQLGGLDTAGVVSLMQALAGHNLGDASVPLAEAIYGETDGNPFFVTELLLHLAESEVIARDADGRWTLVRPLELAALPDTVVMVIGARVGRLGSDAERVLSLAAVIGRDFDVDVLATAFATPEDELLDILDAACSAALVQEMADVPGRYNFSHALIQRTLYEGLGPTRRARAHRQVAEAIESLCAGGPDERFAELAHHWLNSSRGSDLGKALAYSRRAADSALSALAPAEAMRYYIQAQHLYSEAGINDPQLSIDLAIGLGTAQRQSGDHVSRQTLLDASRSAAQLGDIDRLVAAVLANNRGLFSNGGNVDADKVALLEMALELVEADHPDRALLLATLCMELTYGPSFEQRKRLADEALELARASADVDVLVRVLNAVLFPLRVPELLDWSMQRSAEALSVAERIGDPVQLFWAAHNRLGVAAWAGDIEEVDRCSVIRSGCASRLDQPMFDWVCSYMDSLCAQIVGDLDEAAELAKRALAIATRIGEPDAMGFFWVQDNAISYQRGSLSEWIVPLQDAVRDFGDEILTLTSSLLAVGYAQTDRLGDGRQLLDEYASVWLEAPRNPDWLSVMVRYAELAVACEAEADAQILFDLLVPYADQMPVPGITTDGPVSHSLATLATTLGNLDVADAYFVRADALNQRTHAKFFGARTHLSWAKMLISRNALGDRDRALPILTRAQAAARAHGYDELGRRASETFRLLR